MLRSPGVKCVAGIGRLPDEELEATAKLRSLRSESLVHHDGMGRESLVKSSPDIGLTELDEMLLYVDLLKGAPPRGLLVQDPCEARFGWRAALASHSVNMHRIFLPDEGIPGGVVDACVPALSSLLTNRLQTIVGVSEVLSDIGRNDCLRDGGAQSDKSKRCPAPRLKYSKSQQKMNCERHIGTMPKTIPRSLTVSDDDSGDVDAVNADVDPRLAFRATCCEHSITMRSGSTLPDEGRSDVVADAFMPLPDLSQPDSLVHNDRIIMEIPVRYNSNVWDAEFDEMHLHLGFHHAAFLLKIHAKLALVGKKFLRAKVQEENITPCLMKEF